MKKMVWIACVSALLMASGCCYKEIAPPAPNHKAQPQLVVPVEVEQEVTIAEAVSQPTARELFEQEYASLPTEHVVKKGECLWWIAEYQQVYNDPFMWPLIYKANRDQIKNPDLIYPNQTFSLPRQFSKDELTSARKQAGAARPYLPPQNANIPGSLRDELGWGF